jgi:hypothetical protein
LERHRFDVFRCAGDVFDHVILGVIALSEVSCR